MIKNDFSQIKSTINTKLFGMLPNNKEILSYTLTNTKGSEVSIINYGATITSLKIPTATLDKIDVVLGFNTLEDYINSYDLSSAPYLGAIVGRFAGRIKNGMFKLNSKSIQLTKNWKSHQIHGGFIGFSRQFWTVKSTTVDENPSITFEYTSKNNEEHFPGELLVTLTYTLTEENELKVNITAKSSKDTIVNLTQHSYFNLEGHSKQVDNHKLVVNATKILETTNEQIPTGNFIPLQNHEFDFTVPKKCPASIDDTFVLEGKIAAILVSDKTKLKMTVSTNQPAVHIYIGGNCFGIVKGKENANYHKKSGICFETQNFPDAPNHSHFPNSILKKGETYYHETSFKFENL